MNLVKLPPSVRPSEVGSGYPCFDITHPTCTARVATHGAHLMEWTPVGEKPVLYMSPQAIFKEGRPIRGGVPVCWPWFGPNDSDPSLPAHGFARNRFWEFTSASEDSAAVSLVFRLQDDAETRKLWPHAFRLELEMRLGKEPHLSLRMRNTGDRPFTITGALHTYIAVGDISKVAVSGLDHMEYLDTVGIKTDRRQSGDVIFDREVDRNYRTAGEIRIKDEAWGRVISVQGTGSNTAVVWNPWIEKSKTLSDLPDEDYRKFLCVETANAWQDVVTIPSGGEHVLATRVRVE